MVECNCCRESKEHTLANFYVRSSGLLDTICKVCVKSASEKRRRLAGAKPKGSVERVSKEHKLKLQRASQKIYRAKNQHKINSRNRRCRKNMKHLADRYKEELADIYKMCQTLNKLTGGRNFEVDHIIPLNGSNVCGLHVPHNLQVIMTPFNRTKGNRSDGTFDNVEWEDDIKLRFIK